MFWIRCIRSGGVCGYGEAPLKANGVMRTFATRQEAYAVASKLNKDMNGPYATASYHYEVVED